MIGVEVTEGSEVVMKTLDTNTQNTSIVGNFGDGRYSPLMGECFKDLQRIFKVSPEVADYIARKIGSDFGALLSNTTIGLGDVKLGKLSNKGMFTSISEAAAKVKSVNCTTPLYTLRALKYANDAGSFGFSFNDTQWKAGKTLNEYFIEIQTKIDEKVANPNG